MPRKRATAAAVAPEPATATAPEVKDPGAVMTARRTKLAERVAAKGPSSTFQRGARLVQVQLLLAEGIGEAEIVRWLTTEVTAEMVTAAAAEVKPRALTVKPWAVSDTTARDYVRTAWREWQDEERSPMANRRTLDRQRILHVYRTALQMGNLMVALRAAETVARMNGSFLPQLEAPATVDMEFEEAVESIEHSYATLALAKRRNAVTPSQAASAIEVSAMAVGSPPPAPASSDDPARAESGDAN